VQKVRRFVYITCQKVSLLFLTSVISKHVATGGSFSKEIVILHERFILPMVLWVLSQIFSPTDLSNDTILAEGIVTWNKKSLKR
jgi:hypothetical protein